jgi:hypothetical protein
MVGRSGSFTRPLAAVAVLAVAALAVGLHTPSARAAAPAFTKIPTRLYMVPKEHSTVVPDLLAGIVLPIETMKFADVPTGDLISGDSRIIEIASAETSACNHHGTNDFSVLGCTAVQLDVGNGKLKFDPAPVAEDDPTEPNPSFQIYRFASGALLRDADSADDLESSVLALIGTSAEINQTMQTLVYTPTVDDPATQNVDEDYYYDGSDPESLTVDLVPGDTSEGGTVTKSVEIRVLDYNNFPEVTVPQDQWTADNVGTDLELFTPDANSSNPPAVATLEVADEDNDEVVDSAQDGDDAGTDPGDGDDPDDGTGDEFLVIAWATCGQFSLWSNNGWAVVDDLEHVFDYVYDQASDPLANDAGDKEMLQEAFFALLPDEVEDLPFTTSAPANLHTAFAGVANNIEDLNYALGRITFAPRDPVGNLALVDMTCKVRVLISDLGNNGLPLQYLGDPPSGVEIPMFGVDFDTNYAPAVEELTIDIGAGGPVTPTITSVSDVSLAEGDAGTTPFTFTLSLDAPAVGTESVLVSTTHTGGVPNTDDTDLTPIVAQTVTFAAGASSATFTVPVNGDGTVEPDEHFELNLSGAVGLTIGDATGLGTVQNDDGGAAPVQIDTFTGVSLTEGNAGTKDFTFTIGLDDPAPAGGASVRVTTHHVTTDGDDLIPLLSQLVTFAPGQTSRTIVAKVNGDTTVEPTETFTATLSNPNGATIASSAQSATATIVTDDFRHVTIDDVSLSEGNAGDTSFTFTLTLDGPAVGGESVLVSTGGGTATAVTDYTSLTSQPVTFAAGDVSKTVTVLVKGDTDFEPSETFNAIVTTPISLLVDDGTGVGTILNDDVAPPPDITSITNVTMAEGNAGTTAFTFTLTLDAPAPSGSSVLATTTHVSTDDTDLAPLANVPVTFATGATTTTVTVLVNGDPDVEVDETFTLGLSAPTNITIGDSSATGTIQNDDGGAVTDETVTIDDVTLNEGNAGTTSFTFTLTLNGPAEGGESVLVSTNHVSTDDTDLTPLVAVPVAFVNGATTATATVLVNGDIGVEPDETFTVTLSTPQGLLIGDASATGTIVNDDLRHITAINDVALAEGNSGTTDFVFTLTLDGPAIGGEAATATSAHVATDDTDFLDGSVPVAFTTGLATATVTVPVNGDTDVELDETFTVALGSPQNVVIDGGVLPATGTIQNDDGAQTPPTITSISDVSALEGTGGTTNVVFTLTLDAPAGANASVQASTAHGTTDDTDLAALTNVVVPFAQAATTATVTVVVGADPDVEADETFTLTVSNPTNLLVADGSANGTIVNDDVVVQPPSPLTIAVPADITVPNDPGLAGANVTYPAPTTGGGLAPVTVGCSKPSGGFYPLGPTSVTCTATDSNPDPELTLAVVAGSFTITVVDDEPPVITDNPDITRTIAGTSVDVAFPLPTATDNSGVPPTVSCSPVSGTSFNLGQTTVTCTATDGSGNQASSSFLVTVTQTGQLPATGGDVRTPLLVATATLLAGFGLLRQRRRARPAR